MKKFLYGVISVFLILGCSSKKIYEPQKIDTSIEYKKTFKTKLIDVSRDGATYQNGQVITKKDGLLNIKIPKDFLFVNASNNAIVITRGDGEMKILSKTGQLIFEKNFKQQLASATLKDNFLAALLADNTIMLYDIKDDKLIYKEPLAGVVAFDSRLANPLFLNDMVVFATLDGRLLFMDLGKKVVLRDIAISNREFFNNVIFLDELDNTLIAATSSKIISVNPDTINSVNVDVKDIIYNSDKVYVFTKSGKVILFDKVLKKQKEMKFKDAHILAVFETNNRLFGVEKSGYLIEIKRDLSSYRVIKLPAKIEGSLFAYDSKIYFDDRYIEIE